MATKSADTKIVKNGLLPTPPLKKGLPGATLTDNARQVLMKRYVRRGDDGKPAENVEEMFWRVAHHVAKVEDQWGSDIQERTVEYYHLLSSKKFFPNSPTFTGAGTPLGQLAACFVLPISDDMGRHSAGIFQTLRDAALIQQTGSLPPAGRPGDEAINRLRHLRRRSFRHLKGGNENRVKMPPGRGSFCFFEPSPREAPREHRDHDDADPEKTSSPPPRLPVHGCRRSRKNARSSAAHSFHRTPCVISQR